jgi:hypothetical protein
MQILRTFSKIAVAELEQKTCLKFFRGGMGDSSGCNNSVTGVDLCDVWFRHKIDVDFAKMASLPSGCYCLLLAFCIIRGVYDFFSWEAWRKLFRGVFLNDKTIQLFAPFFWNGLLNNAILVLRKGLLQRSISVRAQWFRLIWDTCVDSQCLRLGIVLGWLWRWRVRSIKLLLMHLVTSKFCTAITQLIFFDQDKLLIP